MGVHNFKIIQWHSRDEDLWVQELSALATPANAAAWSRGAVEDWATESLADARRLHIAYQAVTS